MTDWFKNQHPILIAHLVFLQLSHISTVLNLTDTNWSKCVCLFLYIPGSMSLMTLRWDDWQICFIQCLGPNPPILFTQKIKLLGLTDLRRRSLHTHSSYFPFYAFDTVAFIHLSWLSSTFYSISYFWYKGFLLLNSRELMITSVYHNLVYSPAEKVKP